jgi:hypothetical protein
MKRNLSVAAVILLAFFLGMTIDHYLAKKSTLKAYDDRPYGILAIQPGTHVFVAGVDEGAVHLCSWGKPIITEHNGLYSIEVHYKNGSSSYWSGFQRVNVQPDESCR